MRNADPAFPVEIVPNLGYKKSDSFSGAAILFKYQPGPAKMDGNCHRVFAPSLAKAFSRGDLTAASLTRRAWAACARGGRVSLVGEGGCFQVQYDAREAIGEGVVDLASQPLALNVCARLSLGPCEALACRLEMIGGFIASSSAPMPGSAQSTASDVPILNSERRQRCGDYSIPALRRRQERFSVPHTRF